MSGRGLRRAAVVVGTAALLMLAATFVLLALGAGPGDEGGTAGAALWTVAIVGAPVVGLIITNRRPGHPYGWLLLSLGLSTSLINAVGLYGEYAYSLHGRSGAVLLAATLEQVLWPLIPMHLSLLLLLFPDGRLPARRWRWLPVTVVVCGAVACGLAIWLPGELGVATVNNPYAATGVWGGAVTVIVLACVVVLFAMILPAAVSMVIRRRRASGQLRLQLRWFTWATTLVAVVLVGSGAGAFIRNPVLNSALIAAAMTSLYAAIGIAVLRYRLYDIDRIISRTLAWALLSVLLAGIYLAVVTTLTTATAPVAGDSPIAVAAATLVAAAAFQPLRRRIQGAVDRRFNRARYDAALAAANYRTRLRDELDLSAVGDGLVDTVTATLQPSAALLWLRAREEAAR